MVDRQVCLIGLLKLIAIIRKTPKSYLYSLFVKVDDLRQSWTNSRPIEAVRSNKQLFGLSCSTAELNTQGGETRSLPTDGRVSFLRCRTPRAGASLYCCFLFRRQYRLNPVRHT